MTAKTRAGSRAAGVVLAAAVGIAAACAGAATPGYAGPWRIVATTSQIGDLAANIAGELASVTTLLDPGRSPNRYMPSHRDVEELARADLVISVGERFEGTMADRLAGLALGKPQVALFDDAPATPLGADGTAPVWVDIGGWMAAVRRLTRQLETLDPGNGIVYEANAELYLARLETLDAYVTSVLDSVPPGRRVLVTDCRCLAAFGLAYGFEVINLSVDTGAPDPAPVGPEANGIAIADLLVDRAIPAIFVTGSDADPRVAEIIAASAGRGHAVDVVSHLSLERLAARGGYEATFIGRLDLTATAVARALGGRAPPRGMAGRLDEPV